MSWDEAALCPGGLFGSESLDRVHHGGSSRWNAGCGQAATYQQCSDCGHGPWVVGGDLVEKRSQEKTGHVGQDEAEARSCD